FPLPPEIRLRECRFGSSAPSRVVPLPAPGDEVGSGQERPPVVLSHTDPKLGVTVEAREDRESGHLAALAHCTDPGLLNQGEVAVVLFGSREGRLISKKIKLDVAEKGGCGGSADFGQLGPMADELGTQLGMLVFLTK